MNRVTFTSKGMRIDSVNFKFVGQGKYLTRDGDFAHVTAQRANGTWEGFIPGKFSKTWWESNGLHNLARNHDLMNKVPDAT